ncbi:hypothetical protein [Streptomyces acidiscabies]|uniref:Uncharacterized protein n=1 Tax=Streptomyces acidiscabies TaxID=42234 RepID=A0AAP6BA81_9ACTN|nr:hypothetical protein [Streptomyces acidiscabies]MDX2960969.1 hypothetical protein [Streptomyces acidiscabies]MDX3017026.1 hypothetical protein [Streptomyces acidiscabies]MDX3788977.1 hypothetical protein [Streptomyces acidiscabies]GAV43840.1 hypothetical protein Saa2_06798 [Streptomyces acidiscabies]
MSALFYKFLIVLFDKFLIPTVVGLAVSVLVGAVELYRRRRTTPAPPRVLRRFRLLGTAGADGTPLYYETTRAPGSIVTRRVDGLPQRFELTDAPLGDGTYAAEPLDHL